MNERNILIVCPASRDIITFRKSLILKLQKENYKISVIVFDTEYKEEILELNVDFYIVEDDNRGLNPFKILSLKKRYKKVIQQINPDIVFTFMLKPNAFCVKAANQLGIKNIFSMVEGGGDVFGNRGLKWGLIRFVVCRLYKSAFKFPQKVFFINQDDKKEFIERKLVKEAQCEIVPGVGVDLEYFNYRPLKNMQTFLMVSRMLVTKGVLQYCEAASKVKKQFPDAIFNYLGGEGTVTVSDIQQYIDDGSIRYLGTAKDVRPYYEDCSVQVLPTFYREGLVIVNVEAGAIGRPTITCDTVGARDTVNNGYNGFLVPIKDVDALAEKMVYFLNNPEKISEMGNNNRKFVEENFDQRLINQTIFNIINSRLENKNEVS